MPIVICLSSWCPFFLCLHSIFYITMQRTAGMHPTSLKLFIVCILVLAKNILYVFSNCCGPNVLLNSPWSRLQVNEWKSPTISQCCAILYTHTELKRYSVILWVCYFQQCLVVLFAQAPFKSNFILLFSLPVYLCMTVTV